MQVIPHITDEIKGKRSRPVPKAPTWAIVEVGGTVGDIESLPFEAIRQMGIEEGRNNVCYMHLTLLPYIPTAGELKTKPTQHSVKELREIGIQPDILLCRADRSIPVEERRKIALFCNVMPGKRSSSVSTPIRSTRFRACCTNRCSTRSSPQAEHPGQGGRPVWENHPALEHLLHQVKIASSANTSI